MMKLALITAVLAATAIAAASQAQGQHSAPPAATHISPAPMKGPAPAARTATVHTSGSHHNSASSNAASGSTHSLSSNTYSGSYTPWPVGSYFTGPVSPGGFTNPLAGTSKGNHGSKGSTGIILLGGGYGYGYAYDNSGDDSQLQASDQQAEDQGSGGQQSDGQQQPQYIFVQQVADPRGPSAPSSSGSRDQSQNEPEQQAETPVPLPDVGSFTLVTQAGYRLDAVAFTRSADRLVYITPDGGRRSIAFRDLDVDATQRLNTERGTPVTIPPADDATPLANPKTKASSEIIN